VLNEIQNTDLDRENYFLQEYHDLETPHNSAKTGFPENKNLDFSTPRSSEKNKFLLKKTCRLADSLQNEKWPGSVRPSLEKLYVLQKWKKCVF
jgi:hypothetical protein